MNPKETKNPNSTVFKHNQRFVQGYKVIGPSDILPLVKHFSSELHTMWHKIPHWIITADLGRLLYIYYHGGIYLDCDCVIRKPFTTTTLTLFIEHIVPVNQLGPKECKNPQNSVRIANYAFGTSEINHPFLKNVIDECIHRLKSILTNTELSQEDILWVCGPDVITTVYHATNPINVTLLDQSYLQHLCAGSWR